MKQLKKILIISSLGDPPYIGGIENVIDTLVKSSLSDQYEFLTFDTYREPDTNRKIYHKFLFALRLVFACGWRVVKYKPHLVHIHFCSRIDFWKHSICLIVSKILGKKAIFHLHGGSFDTFYQNNLFIKKFVVRSIFRLPDTIIALSNYWYNFLRRLSPTSRILTVPNPIDCDLLSTHSADPLDCYGRSILLLGCLGKRKGHYDVLKAMTLVLKHYSDVIVNFAGLDEDFGATEKLKKIAEELGIINNINFLGAVSGEKKLKLLGHSSIVILPSYAENMPISVLEGMAAKKPVISTRVGAVPEVLGDGQWGVLVDPGDWRKLSEKIIYLFENLNFAKSLGELAQKEAFENWDVRKVTRDVDTLYKKLI